MLISGWDEIKIVMTLHRQVLSSISRKYTGRKVKNELHGIIESIAPLRVIMPVSQSIP